MKRVQEMISLQVEFSMKLSIEFGAAVKEDDSVDMKDVLLAAKNTVRRKKMLNPDSPKNAVVNSMNSHFETMRNGMNGHPQRVTKLAEDMCEILGLTDEETVETKLLAALHDIGLISVPKDIIQKSDALTDREWEEVKKHPETGCNIASINPELSSIASYILAHHERWDGTGYPNGLSGMDIPLPVRIVTLCDVYDVMIHDTFYSKAISEEDAIEELKRCSGSQLDPSLVPVFIRMINGLEP